MPAKVPDQFVEAAQLNRPISGRDAGLTFELLAKKEEKEKEKTRYEIRSGNVDKERKQDMRLEAGTLIKRENEVEVERSETRSAQIRTNESKRQKNEERPTLYEERVRNSRSPSEKTLYYVDKHRHQHSPPLSMFVRCFSLHLFPCLAFHWYVTRRRLLPCINMRAAAS